MAYRVKMNETVLEGLQRIAKEQIDKASDDLRDDDRHEAVHEFRKRCKKIRALLRLFRPALGKTYRKENAWYRDAARELSALRDATSLIETCDLLAERYSDEVGEKALDPIRHALGERRERLYDDMDIEARIAACAEALEEGRERVSSWELDESGFDAIAGGLGKTYKRARKALGRAYADPETEAFHEWRKRVKYHRYHTRLLRDSWRPVLDPWREQLHELSDLLGDDHDLAVLGETLESSERLAKLENRAVVFGLVATQRAELQTLARPLGERLFAEKPSRLVKRCAAYWTAGRAEGKLDSALDEIAG